MEKTTREELIAALISDKYSGFNKDDQSLLESASDARLEEFRSASEARKNAATASVKLEGENRNLTARLKVAEEKISDLEKPLSEDQFLAVAPPRYKALIEKSNAEEGALRSAIITQLKDLGVDGEEELKKKPTGELKALAKYARVSIPDFRGRGLPVDRTAGDEDNESYAPPDPYAAGLKALREKAVN